MKKSFRLEDLQVREGKLELGKTYMFNLDKKLKEDRTFLSCLFNSCSEHGKDPNDIPCREDTYGHSCCGDYESSYTNIPDSSGKCTVGR